MAEVQHVPFDTLAPQLDAVRAAPRDVGRIELIVRRPQLEQREVLAEAQLDTTVGLVGDTWIERPSSRMGNGQPHPEMQITIMNSRVIEALTQTKEQWPLAGDQFYADFDISADALPAGTQLQIGTAVVQISEQPHTGCAKFKARFGGDALHWINDGEGRALRMRGVNAWVISNGVVRVGDSITRC
jgi:hypothetical protein